MKTHANFQGLTTGGRRQRDMADYRMQRDQPHGYVADTRFSGPIDAPEYMPAGSVTDTTCRTWIGHPIIAQTEVNR